MIHGKRTTYRKQGCRCEPCTLANTRASKLYRHLTGAGRDGKPQRPTTVPGDVVRAHMDALYESGWITREIAAETMRLPYGSLDRMAGWEEAQDDAASIAEGTP
jgi:hypothetical protein